MPGGHAWSPWAGGPADQGCRTRAGAHPPIDVFGYPSSVAACVVATTSCVERLRWPTRRWTQRQPLTRIQHDAMLRMGMPLSRALSEKQAGESALLDLVQVTIPRECPMKAASQARSRLAASVALLFSVSIAAPVLAQSAVAQAETPVQAEAGRVVQDDPDNPIKFSIDPAIATGSVSTPELYIGTVGSYLGSRADGKTPVFQDGFGQNPNDILILNDRVGIVLAAGTDDPGATPVARSWTPDASRRQQGAPTSRAPPSVSPPFSRLSSSSTPGMRGRRRTPASSTSTW